MDLNQSRQTPSCSAGELARALAEGGAADWPQLTDATCGALVAQVRFPMIFDDRANERLSKFQRAIASEFPAYEVRDEFQNRLPQTIFFDEENRWRLSLSASSLALESSLGCTPDAFRERFALCLATFDRVFNESIEHLIVDYVGLRACLRITGSYLHQLGNYVRAESSTPQSTLNAMLNHSMVDIELALPEAQGLLSYRCGRLGRGRTFSQSLLSPTNDPSWMLDLDFYLAGTYSSDIKTVSYQINSFLRHARTTLEWCMHPAFFDEFQQR